MGHHQVVHKTCGKNNIQGMVDMCISLPTGFMNNLMMAHLQGRNM
jgi:hypothetical protein